MLEARNGPEALGVAEQHRARIDLLLTDVVMPRMSGFELAKRLHQMHSETRVVYMSAQTVDPVAVRAGLRDPSEDFLLKPFSEKALEQWIREVLDAPQAPETWKNRKQPRRSHHEGSASALARRR